MRLLVLCVFVGCAAVPTSVRSQEQLCAGAADCTIDPAVQAIVEAELDRLAVHRRAVIVVLDPSTGAILGLGGRELGRSDPLLAGKLAVDPGSVMKSFTFAQALESGVVDETTEIAGEGGRWRRGPEELITDRVARGVMSVEDVLVYSSNIGTAKIAVRLGFEPLAELYDALKLADAPLPWMRRGVVPDLRKVDRALATRVSFGAEVEPTPLQLAASFSIFAAKGRSRPLALTLGGLRPATQVLSERTAIRMERLLAQTVARDDGTGAQARLPGHLVAGKTGTWQLEEGVSWADFVGFPSEPSPRWVVLVGVETTSPGYGGGTLAAPSFARVLSALLDPPP